LAHQPSDVVQLAANSENELSSSIQTLAPGGRGWISLRDAWRLFSRVDEQYAFGEMDEYGMRRLEQFAAEATQRATLDFMPVEGRVYFTRL
jgi:hypothetical protein